MIPTSEQSVKTSTVVDALIFAGMVKSKSEGKNLVLSGGFYLNDVKVIDPKRELLMDDLLHNRYLLLRKGKKDYFFLIFSGHENVPEGPYAVKI